MWVRLLLGFFVLLLLGIGGVFWYWRSLFSPAGGPAYTLEVKPGDRLGVIARRLEQKKIVKNARVLRYVMEQNGSASKLQEGEYDLNGQMSVQEVAAKLALPGRLPVIEVTIPEGKRLRDLPAIFEKTGIDGLKIKAALAQPQLSPYTEGKQNDLEGFVFPATYEFRPKDSADLMVGKLVDRLNQELTPERIAKAEALGLEVHDWVVLASLVQAEAANNAEMPVIAGVFLNRLRDRIRLGSDPTVAYGLGKDLPELDRAAGDFAKDTPYNTYTRHGLPPTPINNPGQAALLSIIQPKRKLANGQDALYFLHARDGKIYVNHSYEAHLRDNARHR